MFIYAVFASYFLFFNYSELKNEPSEVYSSNMSPYLYFAQISTLYIYIKLMDVHSKMFFE